MIIGHLGITAALGTVLRAPIRTARLIALCAAAFAPDVVDGLLVLVGECNPVGLYSHTIPVVALEAAIVGGLALLLTNSRATAALFATLVVLHPVGDFFTGSKLLWPAGDLHGLNLYDRPMIDFLLESSLAVGGWWLIRRATLAPRWAVSKWTLAAFLVAQGLLDLYADSYARGIKPNRCDAAVSTLVMRGQRRQLSGSHESSVMSHE